MSMPVVLAKTDRISLRRRIAARLAAATAGLLIRFPPRRLRKLLSGASRGARPATATEALRARQAVVTVDVRSAGQGCLRRSVATVLLCRLRGSWPDWCTGVITAPFQAHAWVEVDGEPIDEGEQMVPFRKVMTVCRGDRTKTAA